MKNIAFSLLHTMAQACLKQLGMQRILKRPKCLADTLYKSYITQSNDFFRRGWWRRFASFSTLLVWARIVQSIWQLITHRTVQVLHRGIGRSSIPNQSSPGIHPASYTMGTGSFLRVKWSGQSINNPFPSSAKVNEK